MHKATVSKGKHLLTSKNVNINSYFAVLVFKYKMTLCLVRLFEYLDKKLV